MNPTLLQLFLLVNVFLVGALTAVAIRHAYAHFRPHGHDAEKAHPPQGTRLPPAVKEQLLLAAQKNFQKILDNAAAELQLDLSKTTNQLNKQLATLGNEIVNDEMKRYRESLDELQKHTETAIDSTQNQLVQHQAELQEKLAERQTELEAKLNEDIAAEKARLIAQIDTKLADAAASFLVETLQHNVDLGAQSAYLTAMLEEHKDDFKKELADDAPATK